MTALPITESNQQHRFGQKLGFNTQREAAIIPMLIPSEVNIREVCKLFDDENIFLNSIEYPAVPREGQRLRLSAMATHTKEDLDLAIAAFARVGKALGIL